VRARLHGLKRDRGVPAGWHHGVVTLGDLFTPVPLRWGLRGDPHLWEAMRLQFAQDALPADQWALIDAVRAAFEELTGVRLGANIGHVPIPAYRTGSGISDGVVDGDWWHDVGQALLLDRWNVASASEQRAR
jgi:hypothetical protein